MQRAGFNVVRMGDLSWDSFEPSQGKFESFDKIGDKMQAAGIRVILDIPGTPGAHLAAPCVPGRKHHRPELSPVHLNLNLPESQFILRNREFRPWRLRDLRRRQSLFILLERLAQRAAVAPAW